MKRVFSIIVIFLTALFSSVPVHFQQEITIADFDSYYKGNTHERIDYHAEYLKMTQLAVNTDSDSCDIVAKNLSDYKNSSSVITATTNPVSIGLYYWFVSKGMYRGIDAACLSFETWKDNLDAVYYDTTFTYGDALSSTLPVRLLGNYATTDDYYYYIVSPCSVIITSSAGDSDYGHEMVVTTANGNYRFTFYNMTCWYCCIRRLDKYLEDLPFPKLTHTDNAQTCSIGKGQVLGVGNSATTVRVEKYNRIEDTWVESSLSKFYSITF